ncbi:MAG: RNA polymerase sigma factor [Rubrobacteraceae bacterium]
METGREAEERDSLAERLADGDPTAPRDLVQSHYTELYRYAFSMLRDRPSAEDAVQMALEKALIALGGYSETRIRALKLRAWLYRITLNVIRNKVRDTRREVPVPEAPENPYGRMQPASSHDNREAWLDTLAALERLPEKQKTAVSMRYLSDLPYSEISEVTGWPEGTVKTLVRRGVVRLRVLLLDTKRKDLG